MAEANQLTKKATRRVQLELPQRSMDRLLNLMDVTDASTYTEVMKNALRLYEAIIKEVESGKEIMIKEKDGKVNPFHIFV
jgi:hypothetical protein